MIFQESVETQCTNRCHTNKDGKAGKQRVEFALQARVFVSEDHNDDDYGGQADHYGKTGSKDNKRDGSDRSHEYFPQRSRKRVSLLKL
jgi:hypothetical protein